MCDLGEVPAHTVIQFYQLQFGDGNSADVIGIKYRINLNTKL